MAEFIAVTVGSSGPLYLQQDLLTENSRYFRSLLEGKFSESESKTVQVDWDGDENNCLLFLSWIGINYNPEEHFTSVCMLLFLKCCKYFQVKEKFWETVRNKITLPSSYSKLRDDLKSIWIRETIPFPIMKEISSRVCSKIDRFEFAFAWFNEISATSEEEKEELQTTKDFFLLRRYISEIITIRSPIPASSQQSSSLFGPPISSGMPSNPFLAPNQVLINQQGQLPGISALMVKLEKYPIAANAVSFLNFWKMSQDGTLNQALMA